MSRLVFFIRNILILLDYNFIDFRIDQFQTIAIQSITAHNYTNETTLNNLKLERWKMPFRLPVEVPMQFGLFPSLNML